MGNKKKQQQTVKDIVQLFQTRSDTLRLISEEIEKQIEQNEHPEIVQQTYQEFLKIATELNEYVDRMSHSKSALVDSSMRDSHALTLFKIRVSKQVKQHEISNRMPSRASSRSSMVSRRSMDARNNNGQQEQQNVETDTQVTTVSNSNRDSTNNHFALLTSPNQRTPVDVREQHDTVLSDNQQDSDTIGEGNFLPNVQIINHTLQQPTVVPTTLPAHKVSSSLSNTKLTEAANSCFTSMTTSTSSCLRSIPSTFVQQPPHQPPQSVEYLNHGHTDMNRFQALPSTFVQQQPHQPPQSVGYVNEYTETNSFQTFPSAFVQQPPHQPPQSVGYVNHEHTETNSFRTFPSAFVLQPPQQPPQSIGYMNHEHTETNSFQSPQQLPFKRSVKLPDIKIQKFHGDPLKWHEWSSMFCNTIHQHPQLSDVEKMSYLQTLVEGSAKETIAGYLCNPNFYRTALDELERRFGNPRNVVAALTNELELFPKPGLNDHSQLISYSALLRKIVQTFKAHGFIADMYSTYLLKTARDKLPMALKVKWSESVVDNNLNNPGLFELQQWMEKQSRTSELLQESQPMTTNSTQSTADLRQRNTSNSFSKSNFRGNFNSSNNKRFPKNYNVNNTDKNRTTSQTDSGHSGYQSSSQQHPQVKVHKCPIDKEEHYVGKCPKFLAMTVAQRVSEIKKQGLCFNCLSDQHTSKDCLSKSTCRECKRKHHTLIHENKRYEKTNALCHELPLCEPVNSTDDLENLPPPPDFPHVRNELPMMAIRVFGPNCSFDCYALLDSCSSISYITNEMASKVNAPSTKAELHVKQTFDTSSLNANLVRVTIGKYQADTPMFRLNYVYAAGAFNFDTVPVDEINNVCTKYSHLEHISYPQLGNNKVQVLLGIDGLQYFSAREPLAGPSNSPMAFRTLLGWYISGTIRDSERIVHRTNFHCHSNTPFDHAMTLAT